MKKILKVIPLFISIFLMVYSVFAYSKVKGFNIFEETSTRGMFYVSTYKYTAAFAIVMFLVYIVFFSIYLNKKRKSKKPKEGF